MINSKSDYLTYIEADKKALGAKTKHPLVQSANSMVWLCDPVCKFQRLLRKLEYWTNCHNRKRFAPYLVFLRWRYQRLSAKLGFTIPLNVCGPGLCLAHYGSIIISRHAKIGSNCVIHGCVNIGAHPKTGGAPIIGNNVFIGLGAKLFNRITIADDVMVGANAVVSKDVLTPGSVVISANVVRSPKSRSN